MSRRERPSTAELIEVLAQRQVPSDAYRAGRRRGIVRTTMPSPRRGEGVIVITHKGGRFVPVGGAA